MALEIIFVNEEWLKSQIKAVNSDPRMDHVREIELEAIKHNAVARASTGLLSQFNRVLSDIVSVKAGEGRWKIYSERIKV